MVDDRLKVEAAQMRDLSADLTDLAGKIRTIMDTLKANCEPLESRPVEGTHEPGENFKKNYDSQRDSIHAVGTSYEQVLGGDFATNFNDGATLLEHMDADNGADFGNDKMIKGYKA